MANESDIQRSFLFYSKLALDFSRFGQSSYCPGQVLVQIYPPQYSHRRATSFSIQTDIEPALKSLLASMTLTTTACPAAHNAWDKEGSDSSNCQKQEEHAKKRLYITVSMLTKQIRLSKLK